MAQQVDHSAHRSRLKKRFLNEGLEHFEQHNMLELLLFYAIPRVDTNELAHRLLAHFGSLSAVLEASVHDLMKVPGIGQNSATLIRLTAELCRAYLEDKHASPTLLRTGEEIGNFLKYKFFGKQVEVMYLLCLDARGGVLFCGQLAEGTVDTVPVLTRSIVEVAIRVNAASVVLAHNHPNGFAIPSTEDLGVTRQVYQALQAVGIRLRDHIVVADDDYVSMAQSGSWFR